MSERQESVVSEAEVGSESDFVWHPIYAGKSETEVRSIIMESIRRDQLSHGLAMDAAEASESDSLTTVVELERRWSPFDFDWAEMDPAVLGHRILAFEMAREAAQEMIPFDVYRSTGVLVSDPVRESAAPESSLPIMKIGVVILALLIVVFIVAVWL